MNSDKLPSEIKALEHKLTQRKERPTSYIIADSGKLFQLWEVEDIYDYGEYASSSQYTEWRPIMKKEESYKHFPRYSSQYPKN